MINVTFHLTKAITTNMCATILNYKKHESPSFQTHNIARSLVLVYQKEETSSHIYLQDMRENFQTGRRKAPPKTALP